MDAFNERREKPGGRLKIFFGYAPGVGKTYQMLNAALNAKRRGVDVVCGMVNTNGRPRTGAMLRELPILPPLKATRHGGSVKEFDLDAALKRRPQLILIDDLAHTNADICRHGKRYRDVEELLKAGIDVYTTVGVQNIESLNDVAAETTGAPVRERIPDSVFDGADQVELVDIEPSELMERLKAGLIYYPKQTRQAAADFFTVEKLTALREIALRRCADRANLCSERARLQGGDEYRVSEHVLVCLSPAPSGAKIIRTAARMAGAFHGALTALFVETSDFLSFSPEDKSRLRDNMRLAEQLGANIETVYGDDIAYQIAEFTRLSSITKIVLGRSTVARRHFLSKPALTDQLIKMVPSIDIHIIPDSMASTKKYHVKRKRGQIFSPRDTLLTAAVFLLATGLSILFNRMGFGDANIIMAYILGVLVTALVTAGQRYSIIFSFLSVVVFNFLFTEPRFTLHAYDRGYPVTFLIMFLTAYIASTLTARLKAHVKQSAQAAYRTKLLLDTDQLLNRATGRDEIIRVTANQVLKLLKRNLIVYPCENGEMGEPFVKTADGGGAPEQMTSAREKDVALWTMINNKHAGATTDTFSGAECLYLTIRVNRAVYGVIGIAAQNAPLENFERSILLSILGECALALENEKNAREKEAAAILAKNEQLRANLLRAISHDLRTPLTSISGNAGNLMANGEHFDAETKQRLYTDLYDDAMWLINLVENLLSVTRIEDGKMNIRPTAELMDEVVAEALKHVNRRSAEHTIKVSESEEFILARVDARLIIQVIINIVDNAIKYTPGGSTIEIEIKKQGGWVIVRISDNGPGIPSAIKERVFDMFFSGGNRIADSRRSLGLGLALCKSIVTAHGGRISVLDNQPNGATFEFTLPAEEVKLNE